MCFLCFYTLICETSGDRHEEISHELHLCTYYHMQSCKEQYLLSRSHQKRINRERRAPCFRRVDVQEHRPGVAGGYAREETGKECRRPERVLQNGADKRHI